MGGPSTPTTDLARMSLDDAAHCRRIVRRHARTFWLASRFLPAAKRRASFALYAFCRVADDMVDVGARGASGVDVIAGLSAYRAQLDDAMRGGADTPLFRELANAVRRYDVPPRLLHELLDGIARDCAPTQYACWDDLSCYCEGVASSVGEMCAHVFGMDDDPATRVRALRLARTLGIAMQLTNVLRDVGEDARNGRCYLPHDDLARFGFTPGDVLRGDIGGDARWKAFMQFEIARARTLYERAMPGIALLSADSRRCAAACAIGYAGILGAIETIGYDTFRTRARLGTVARAGVLWSAWRTPAAASVRAMPLDDRSMVRRA